MVGHKYEGSSPRKGGRGLGGKCGVGSPRGGALRAVGKQTGWDQVGPVK